METTKHKILLVEDDKLDQKAFCRLVREQNLPYDCTIAGSVSEAQSILASHNFDVVIADYSLGDGTAFDVLSLVKNTPTILVTGTGDEEIAVKAWKAGAYDYLIKDIERSYLKAVPITVENTVKHKKIEEQVHLLSGAVMSTDDSVYITDMENKIIFVNKAFCKTYGYHKEEIVGKDGNILWIGKSQSKDTRSVFRMVRSAYEVGFYHKRKDGSILPVSMSRSIIKDPSGNDVAVVTVARDISERIIVEDELRTLNQKLEKLNQLKSKLAIAVTTQLTTTVAKLKDNINSVPGDTEKDSLQAANETIDNIKKIVNDFLNISLIDCGEMKPNLANTCLNSVAEQAVTAISPLVAEKQINLETNISESELTVNADRPKLIQILTSLLKNAIDDAPVKGCVTLQVNEDAKEITIKVQDNGPCIEQDQINKIFDRFCALEKNLQPGQTKSTLTLPLLKELVQMQGGSVWAENTGRNGKVICFTLTKAAPPELVTAAGPMKTKNYY